MAKARVLLVEDNAMQGQMATTVLEKNDYDVVWVREGGEAIKAARTKAVDIILLDVILPDMSGIEVCRWLRIHQETRGLPIIAVTVRDSTTDRVASLEAGADDHMPKPYDEVELNARIYACLRTKGLLDELRQRNRELEAMLERVELLAITDHLTELFNRRRFELIAEKEFNRTLRYRSPLACLMVDIDFFKRVNDEFGHKTGDLVLREIAQIIKSQTREVDTPARWGGEEFVVLLPETEKEPAVRPAQRILHATAQHQFPGMSGRQVTVSIGVAAAPADSIDTVQKLINASDIAMYEAKKKGRNCIELAP